LGMAMTVTAQDWLFRVQELLAASFGWAWRHVRP
jgi:hypothetical protein